MFLNEAHKIQVALCTGANISLVCAVAKCNLNLMRHVQEHGKAT